MMLFWLLDSKKKKAAGRIHFLPAAWITQEE